MKQPAIPIMLALVAGMILGWQAKSYNLSIHHTDTVRHDNYAVDNEGVASSLLGDKQAGATGNDKFQDRYPQIPPLTATSDNSNNAQNNQTASGYDQTSSSLEDRLKVAGIPDETIKTILTVFAQNRTELLELRYRATQEGWQDSEKYREELAYLSDPNGAIKSATDPQYYDQYLYAMGIDNRVIVQEIYTGSQAEALGIKRDDIIVSYANNPIFSMADLIKATSESEPGKQVLLELQRNGSNIYLTAQSGPLGIEMGALSLSPSKQ